MTDLVVGVGVSVLGAWLVEAFDMVAPMTKASLSLLWRQPAIVAAVVLALGVVAAEAARRRTNEIRFGSRLVIKGPYLRKIELAFAVALASMILVVAYGALSHPPLAANARTSAPSPRLTEASAEVTAPGEMTIYPGTKGFVTGGAKEYWFYSDLGVAGTGLYTMPDGNVRQNWARWTFDLGESGSGLYELHAFIPRDFATTRNAKYIVNTAHGRMKVSLDQSVSYDVWVPLGTFEFDARDAWVELDDATGEIYEGSASPLIGFDAMRVTPLRQPE